MLLWCLQHGRTALIWASENRQKSIVEFLIIEGNANYTDCMDNRLVKAALVKYQEMVMQLLGPWLPVPGLCAIATGYCFEYHW